MSQQSHYHALISRGRKAGLNTRKLYSALAMRPPEGGERSAGQSDGNGYISTMSSEGHPIYRPANRRPS